MKQEMTNKERMIATFKHQETDYIPLHLEINQSYEVHDVAKHWHNQFERLDYLLSLGVDASVELWLPDPFFHPDVKVYQWKEEREGEKYTLLVKQYDTPKGTLRQVIKETEDLYDYWHINKNTLGRMHSKISGIGMIEDVNPSRSVEFLIKGPEDLEKMRYLFQPASGILLNKWKEAAQYCKREAEKRDVIMIARRLHCGSDIVWLTDMLDSMLAMHDNPDYIEEFLDIIQKWQMTNLELALDAGADVVTRFGYYDCADFWGSKFFERYLAPRMDKEAELCHRYDAWLSQQQSEGLTQQASIYKNMKVDILRDIDPIQGNEDMVFLKKELGDKKTLWGGINLIDFSMNDSSMLNIDEMVKRPIEEMGKGGGFVLHPIPGVYVEVKWEDVIKMIDSWEIYRTLYIT